MPQPPADKTSPARAVYSSGAVRANISTPAHYAQVQFLMSAPTLAGCPADQGMEIAFAGRSNAGKSSAINVLTRHNLARTSKTPGRTQLINFFQVDDQRRLVDLPGYGYAKVPEAIRRDWGRHLGDYIQQRQCLCGLILLMDVRHPLTDLDRQLLAVATRRLLPVHLLLTKADKLKRGPARQQLAQVLKEVNQHYPHGVSAQLFSSLNQEGRVQVWQQLDQWLHWPAVHQDGNMAGDLLNS